MPWKATNKQEQRYELVRRMREGGETVSELCRRSKALGPAQEAVDLYRALARANPDAFTPDLASSLGMLGQVREGNDDRQGALACFREGVEILTPAFAQLPEAFAPLMEWLVQNYRHLSGQLGQPPDDALLEPVNEGLQRLASAAPPDPGGPA